jgi:hypothetical protein
MDYEKLTLEILERCVEKAGFFHQFDDDDNILVYAGSHGEYDCTEELHEFAFLFLKELVAMQIQTHILSTIETNLKQ